MPSIRKILLLASGSMMISGAAHAQAPASETRLEEIVVTAQRRSQNLQDVPIAVSAVTAQTAARLGLNDSISLSQAIPGLNLGRSGNSASPFVRGIGTNAGFVGNEPSVATFVDDVYVPTGAGASFDFNNIESVELLKGPQGTLFGRNATGGVIHIRTRNPTHTPTADVSVGYGNYDTFLAQGYVSGGLTETLAANLAVNYTNQSKGWGTNVNTGGDVFARKAYGARVKLLWEPSDDDRVLLTYSFDRNKTNQGVALRAGVNAFSFGGYSPDRAGAGFYDATVTAGSDTPYRNTQQQFALHLRHDFENARFVSITAYNDFESLSTIDTDTTPTDVVTALPPGRARTFTQEFQLLSSEDATVNWIMGAYFLKDISSFDADFSGIAFGGVNHQYLNNEVHSRSYSGFAQASTEILPRTNMTIGVRYTSDRREFNGLYRLGPPGGAAVAVRGPFYDQATFSSLTGRLALDYKLSEDTMIYAAYNRGFKSGVYNLPSLNGASTAAPPPVVPEDLNAYSAGFKSEFADGRLRLNAEAWLYDYKNIQVVNQVFGGQILTNAGAAEIKGIDFDLTALPVENLTLTAAVSIADGEYTKFPGGPTFYGTQLIAGDPNSCTMVQQTPPTRPHAQLACNLKGKKTIQTIPLSVNLIAAYRIPTSFGPFDLTASWSHGGDFYWEADNDIDSHQRKTDVFNASIQWTAASDAFSVKLWGRNLGQEKYYAYGANSATSNFKYSPAPPRTYGVTVSAHY